MECAERFGKTLDVERFKPSQLTEMLALPSAEETEKFIAEKAAEGKKVADMTIKELRKEIFPSRKKSFARLKTFCRRTHPFCPSRDKYR